MVDGDDLRGLGEELDRIERQASTDDIDVNIYGDHAQIELHYDVGEEAGEPDA